MNRHLGLAVLWGAIQTVGAFGLPGTINVKDYGARGDGSTDDTAAITAAVQAARKRVIGFQVPGAIWVGTQPEVVFPSGVYCLSKPICLGAYDRLLGEGNAILKANDAGQNILECSSAYRLQIRGIGFVGGKRSISVDTKNVDTANILVLNCQFLSSSDFAVYIVDGSASTFLKISECIFVNCRQVLYNTCDKAVLSDCWISTCKEMKNQAVIVNKDVLHMERVLGVPFVSRDNDQRWIDNYYLLVCRDVRFGGEWGGFCAVNNYAKYVWKYPLCPTGVVLENCQIYALGNPAKKTAIYCKEIPNQIIVRNCTGMIDLPILTVDGSIELQSYMAEALKNPKICRIKVFDGNVNQAATVIPRALQIFVEK